jgi:hypothetical protein
VRRPFYELDLAGESPIAHGKFVYCVSFLDRKGKRLPGGARRLSNAVDSRADLHFELVRRAMRIEEVLAEMAIAV